ncbi:MAG: GspE/PulE family protein [Candidatus Nealsonbacteria bacterium]|nr:GspE/PulE family protein [Candidatus Nealsonbacteria bacterium]
MNQEITKQIEIPEQFFLKIQKEINNISDFQKSIEKNLNEKITDLISIVLGGSMSLKASDVHIEPQEKDSRLRVRIDGILHEVASIPIEISNKIVSRLKLLSELKLNVAERPQDGRFSILVQNNPIEIRSSTLPSQYGESIVLRILNPKDLVSIEDLGLREDLFNLFKNEIKKPNGMIIVTGPTGSGKTTTLYTFLKDIQNPKIKIITIEDPIEYHLKGISQTQVVAKKGYDFASGLKSIMRQDPDVILVGEIRDLETVEIALQAALTGHLVLSTLHANDAAGTITRLISLGANPVNIAPALSMAVAQRLVRKVCKKCGKRRTASAEEAEKIKAGLRDVEIKTKNLVPLIDKIKIIEAKGCKECNFTGYSGRVGIFEVFLVDPEIEKFILTSPSISALREMIVKKGMITMRQDGLIKVLEGTTTIEEVERVVE